MADILRRIFLNFSPKEYESEILHVQIVQDGFEDSLQQLSPANDIVLNTDYLEQGDLLGGIVNWMRLLGSVAGPVIQANGRLSFEDDLRSGGLFYCFPCLEPTLIL